MRQYTRQRRKQKQKQNQSRVRRRTIGGMNFFKYLPNFSGKAKVDTTQQRKYWSNPRHNAVVANTNVKHEIKTETAVEQVFYIKDKNLVPMNELQTKMYMKVKDWMKDAGYEDWICKNKSTDKQYVKLRIHHDINNPEVLFNFYVSILEREYFFQPIAETEHMYKIIDQLDIDNYTVWDEIRNPVGGNVPIYVHEPIRRSQTRSRPLSPSRMPRPIYSPNKYSSLWSDDSSTDVGIIPATTKSSPIATNTSPKRAPLSASKMKLHKLHELKETQQRLQTQKQNPFVRHRYEA